VVVQDLAYILATIGFFGLMVLFVSGCERIVGDDDNDAVPGGERPAALLSSTDEEVTA
jgi:hypothetical protein